MPIEPTTTYTCSDGTQYADEANAVAHEEVWQAQQDREARIDAWMPVIGEFCTEVLEHPDKPQSCARLTNSSRRLIEWLLDRGYTIEVPEQQA